MLAEAICANCGGRYYGDLAVGHGIFYPMIVDAATGEVTDDIGARWFAELLSESFASRRTGSYEFAVDVRRTVRGDVVVLNALDVFYGHALLKIFNAQYYLDHEPSVDLIAIVPSWLEWLVPAEVPEVWTVDTPLRQSWRWDDRLDDALHNRLNGLRKAMVSVAFPHPHPRDVSIERFTGIHPFPLDEWSAAAPTVTFIWRDDRLWGRSLRQQLQNVRRLATSIRSSLPDVEIAVAGVAPPGGLPSDILDLRSTSVGPIEEREWCAQYARSHVVVGIHGSNLLLPSAHAGAVVDLLPRDREGNMGQDIFPRGDDVRDVLLRYRTLPDTTTAQSVAQTVTSMLMDYPSLAVTAGHQFSDHSCAMSVLDVPNRWQAAMAGANTSGQQKTQPVNLPERARRLLNSACSGRSITSARARSSGTPPRSHRR